MVLQRAGRLKNREPKRPKLLTCVRISQERLPRRGLGL